MFKENGASVGRPSAPIDSLIVAAETAASLARGTRAHSLRQVYEIVPIGTPAIEAGQPCSQNATGARGGTG